MRHRSERVIHEVGAIVNSANLYSGRQAISVEIIHRGLDRLQYFGRIFTAPHEHDAFDASRLVADAKDTRRGSGAQLHLAQVFDKNRHALRFRHHHVFDVRGILNKTNAADHHGLLLVVEHGATRVAIVRLHGIRHLGDG